MEAHVRWGIRASRRQHQCSEVVGSEGMEAVGSEDSSVFSLFSHADVGT